VSTSAVDTWRDVEIQTKNLTEVPNGCLPLIQVPPMIQNKTEVLNLKSRKTQVPIGYLTLFFFLNGRQACAFKWPFGLCILRAIWPLF
jgi:LysM repeat protein